MTRENNIFKESLDDIIIKNIDQSDWFRTMDHYPRTIGHVKLLVSIVDKIGIFNKFDLAQTSNMNSNKLNIMYAVLRIMNKVFNKYLDYVVKKIFRDGLKEIFYCTHLTYYDLFFDQLTQDLDHFVCSVIRLDYPNMDAVSIKYKFVMHLQFIFEKAFYQNIIKKLTYNIDSNFYIAHNNLFLIMAQEFVKYTKEMLSETYETMKIFLEKIFSPNCSEGTIFEIMAALEKHIDLKNLFKENCMEIDIYCEQKLDDDFEWEEQYILSEPFYQEELNKINYFLGDIQTNKMNAEYILDIVDV